MTTRRTRPSTKPAELRSYYSFGRKVVLLRESAGLNQAAFAGLVGCDAPLLCRIEGARMGSVVLEIARQAALRGFDLNWLFDFALPGPAFGPAVDKPGRKDRAPRPTSASAAWPNGKRIVRLVSTHTGRSLLELSVMARVPYPLTSSLFHGHLKAGYPTPLARGYCRAIFRTFNKLSEKKLSWSDFWGPLYPEWDPAKAKATDQDKRPTGSDEKGSQA